MRAKIPFATLVRHYPEITEGLYIAGDFDIETELVLRYGELTPIYQEPSYLKAWIAQVGRQLKWSIDKMYQVTQLEYNPIENYDRKEDTTEDTSATGMNSFKQGAITETETSSYGSSDENTVAAFNSASYQPSEKLSRSGEDTRTNNLSKGEDVTNTSDTGKLVRESRVHGNIGVTTTQQMMEAEIKIAEANYIEKVCSMYANLLFIQIW